MASESHISQHFDFEDAWHVEFVLNVADMDDLTADDLKKIRRGWSLICEGFAGLNDPDPVAEEERGD